jgi:hypothetical protein
MFIKMMDSIRALVCAQTQTLCSSFRENDTLLAYRQQLTAALSEEQFVWSGLQWPVA